MSTKGISPIIAMVLIVLITISLTGAFLVWSQRSFTQLGERGTEQTQRFTGQFQKGVQIVAHDCTQATGSDFVYVKNTGEVAWGAHGLVFLVNETLNTSVITFDNNGNVAPGSIVKATFGQPLEKNYVVRVVFQEAQDSIVCK